MLALSYNMSLIGSQSPLHLRTMETGILRMDSMEYEFQLNFDIQQHQQDVALHYHTIQYTTLNTASPPLAMQYNQFALIGVLPLPPRPPFTGLAHEVRLP